VHLVGKSVMLIDVRHCGSVIHWSFNY